MRLTTTAPRSFTPDEAGEYLALAERFADESRRLIIDSVEQKLAVEQKADRSFVTDLDKNVEDLFRSLVSKHHPEAGVIGEEYGRTNPTAALQWVVDPIDGTAELVAGVPTFGTVIGLLYNGYPVAGVFDHPLMNLRVSGARGCGAFRNGKPISLQPEVPQKVRLHLPPMEAFARRGLPLPHWYPEVMRRYPATRTYFTCLSLAAAASGGVEVSVEWDLRIWDFAAAPVIVEEAGGSFSILSRYDDDEGEERFSFVMGNRELAESIESTIKSEGETRLRS